VAFLIYGGNGRFAHLPILPEYLATLPDYLGVTNTSPNQETSSVSQRPVIGIPASLIEVAERRYPAHATGARNIDAIVDHTGCIPMVIPALGDRIDVKETVQTIDGLLLTGGRANVEPHHYDGPDFPEDEPIDPARDCMVLPLIRACIDARVPIFGVCRGIQEMNVALGGSLHYRVHMVAGKEDHRMPREPDVTMEEIFKLRHSIALTANGLFASLIGAESTMVNSLHGQGVDRLADSFTTEALSPDGVIEGIRLVDDESFTVGVQWHAEYEPEHHLLARKLFERFGEAARSRRDCR
jgi:putative glutamine amidotransferase